MVTVSTEWAGALLLIATISAPFQGSEGFLQASGMSALRSFPHLRHPSAAAFSYDRLRTMSGRCRSSHRCPSFRPGGSLGCRILSRTLNMALGPVGPFCPYRSTFFSSGAMDREMAQLTGASSNLYGKFAGYMERFRGGNIPEKAEIKRIAEEMDTHQQQWKIILTRLLLADDFQALQFFKLADARIRQYNITLDEMNSEMSWHIDCMKAFANDSPLPAPPPGVQKKMGAQNAQEMPMPTMSMASSSAVYSMPFLQNAKALQSPVVTEELDGILRDHKALVKMGETYGKWDREGKKMYIEQMEKIEERWEIFLKRFELMGELNPEFLRETEEFMKAQQIGSVEAFKTLLKQTRDLMRADAERT